MIEIKFIPNNQQWDRMYARYMALSGKLPHEVANKDVRDVGLKAVQYTKAVQGPKIREELNAPSRVNPKVPLAQVLAARAGKTRSQFVSGRVRSANYVRAGWLEGVRKIPAEKGRSSFVPRMRTSGKMGDGKAAVTVNGKATAVISNNVGSGNEQITEFQRQGLEKGKAATYFDRLQYIERKQSQLNKMF